MISAAEVFAGGKLADQTAVFTESRRWKEQRYDEAPSSRARVGEGRYRPAGQGVRIHAAEGSDAQAG
ncbi:MAG: hypothetical protein WBM40_19545 [Thiohalocapsa sp.]